MNKKLENEIMKFLENKGFEVNETIKNYYFFENGITTCSEIRVCKSDMSIHTYYGLLDDITSFFSIDFEVSKRLLVDYVEKTLNIKATHLSILIGINPERVIRIDHD